MIDDGEPAAFYARAFPKARKTHKCDECGREIAPGELYERVAAKWEGEITTLATCAHCQEARLWLEVVCEGWLHGGVLEDLSEHRWEGYSPLLEVLAEQMRRGWTRKKDGRRITPRKVRSLVYATLPLEERPVLARKVERLEAARAAA